MRACPSSKLQYSAVQTFSSFKLRCNRSISCCPSGDDGRAPMYDAKSSERFLGTRGSERHAILSRERHVRLTAARTIFCPDAANLLLSSWGSLILRCTHEHRKSIGVLPKIDLKSLSKVLRFLYPHLQLISLIVSRRLLRSVAAWSMRSFLLKSRKQQPT